MPEPEPCKLPSPPAAPVTSCVEVDGVRELTLEKHGERFVFTCPTGEEEPLLEQLIHMVRDPNCPLDWFDAAVLSHQMGRRLGDQLRKMIRA